MCRADHNVTHINRISHVSLSYTFHIEGVYVTSNSLASPTSRHLCMYRRPRSVKDECDLHTNVGEGVRFGM